MNKHQKKGLSVNDASCLDAFMKCSRDIQKIRSSPCKLGRKLTLLLVLIGALILSWICNTRFLIRIAHSQKNLRLQQQWRQNRTIVFLIGNLRCGEPAWESLYKNVLDFNQADLGLVVGASDEKYNDASLWKRAKYVFREKEYDDWGDALDTLNIEGWRENVEPRIQGRAREAGVLGGVKGHKTSGAIQNMMRYWLAQHIRDLKLAEKYDRFIVTRTDQFYMCPYDMSDFPTNAIVVPEGEDWGAINDRHFTVSKDKIFDALDVLPPFLRNEYSNKTFYEIESPEHLLLAAWKFHNLHIYRTPRNMFTCMAKDGDMRRTGDVPYGFFAGGQEHQGIKVKYETEYWWARATCSSRLDKNGKDHSKNKSMTLASVQAMEETIHDLTNRSLNKDWEIWWREKMLHEKVWTPRTYKDQLMEQWKKLERHAYALNSTTPLSKSIVNFIHRQTKREDSEQIVITMQASANVAKLDHMILNLRKWDGPGSIALYIQNSDDVDLISSWLSNYTIAWYLRECNIHIMMEKIVDFSPYPEPTMQWTYPYNTLRNLALENTGSDYFLLLDVDLIITPHSHAYITELLRNDPQITEKMRRKRTLFVLPAFEVCPDGITQSPKNAAIESDLPLTKSDLVRMVEEKSAWIFYSDVDVKNQGSTKSEKWYNFTEAAFYPIDWELNYEPYVIGYLPGIPRFWTGIRGYGYDKVSWFHELYRAGYAMSVLRDLYVVHLCHPRTPIKLEWEKWPNTRKFIQFDPFLMAKYGNCREVCSVSPEPWSIKCEWGSCAQCSDCITEETCPTDCLNSNQIPWEERCAWGTCVGKCPACLKFF